MGTDSGTNKRPDPLLLENALRSPPPAIRYHLGRMIQEYAGERTVVALAERELDFAELAEHDGFCTIAQLDGIHADRRVHWQRRAHVGNALSTSWNVVKRNGVELEVVVAKWRDGYGMETAQFVIGDDGNATHAFVRDALDASHVPQRSVLVFAHSCFSKERSLFTAAQQAQWEDLVLPGDLAARMRGEIRSFLGAKAAYARYGVPYKRGLLLTGPPGNGKTHCIRLLIKEAALPCLYVKSFAARYGEEEANIAAVFGRARSIAPCMLVLEDIDSLVKPHCLSVFLNEMDGLRSDTGILTVASTNHPERLDPALLQRPSRFDRKYAFDLPGAAERTRYFETWNAKLEPDMQIDRASLDAIVEQTDKMSFAFLKELAVSAMVRWISEPTHGTMGKLLQEEHEALRTTWRPVDEGDAPPKPEKSRRED